MSSDGDWIVAAVFQHPAPGQLVRVWNLKGGNVDAYDLTTIQGFGPPARPFLPPSFSADGRWLIAAEPAGVHFWDVDAEDLVESHTSYRSESAIREVETTHDARWCVAIEENGTLRRWDMNAPLSDPLTVNGLEQTADALAVSQDGSLLVLARGNQATNASTQVWNLSRRGSTIRQELPERAIQAAISRHNKWLVTCTDEEAVYVRDLRSSTSDFMAKLVGFVGRANTIFFIDDDRFVIRDQSTAYLYDLNLDRVISRARELVGRELTERERKLFLLDP